MQLCAINALSHLVNDTEYQGKVLLLLGVGSSEH
jgi:hypothetical protein